MCSCSTAGCPISAKKMREQEKYLARGSEDTRGVRKIVPSLARRVYFDRSVSFLQNCHSVFVRSVTSGRSNHEVFK